jgi:RNA methyltransferase, TrmH family
MTITSPHNERLKELRKLARRRVREQSGRFVAEGEDLLAAADAAGCPAVERYCAAGSGLPGVEVEPELLAAVSQLGSGTRALGVYEQRWADAPAGPLCVALWGIADPGNVGTVLRAALAFGASSVALGPDCADPYGPKAVRASMGALFAVPLARVGGVAELPGTVVALDAQAQGPIAALSAEAAAGATGAGASSAASAAGEPLTLLVGAERAGLPPEVLEAADRVVRIPIETESLNAAMAATVALYEVTRGRVGGDHRMDAA